LIEKTFPGDWERRETVRKKNTGEGNQFITERPRTISIEKK